MKIASHGLALALVVSATGCLPARGTAKGDHVQSVVVHTNPEGATIWQRVGGEVVELGTSPIELRGGYSVLARRTTRDDQLLEAGNDVVDLGQAVGGKGGAGIAVAGLALSFVGLATAIASTRQEPEVEGSQIALVATKPGYLAQSHVVQFPRPSPTLTLQLTPEPAPTPADAKPSPDGKRQAEAPPLDLFGYQCGLAINPIAVETSAGEISGPVSDRLTAHLATALDRVGFAGPGPDRAAALILDTRLLAVGELCILSATLYRAEDHQAWRVATARGACDLEALDATIERLAGKLAPFETGLATEADPDARKQEPTP